MHTPPTSVISTAMTIATMGRLTKNSDIVSGILLRRRAVRGDLWRRRRPVFHFDRAAFAGLLSALHNDTLARLETINDFPHRADALARFHRPNAYFVIVAHNRDLEVALQLGHGFLRNNQRTLLRFQNETHATELTGAQCVSRIWKGHLIANRAGLIVEATIDRVRFSFVRVGLSVAQDQFELERLEKCVAFIRLGMFRNEIRKRSLTSADQRLDRIDL